MLMFREHCSSSKREATWHCHIYVKLLLVLI